MQLRCFIYWLNLNIQMLFFFLKAFNFHFGYKVFLFSNFKAPFFFIQFIHTNNINHLFMDIFVLTII